MEGGERGAEHYVACWVAGAREGLLCSVGRDDGRDSIVGTRTLGRATQKLRFREQWPPSSAFAGRRPSRLSQNLPPLAHVQSVQPC